MNLRTEIKRKSPKYPGDFTPYNFSKRVHSGDLSEKNLQKNVDTKRSYGP